MIYSEVFFITNIQALAKNKILRALLLYPLSRIFAMVVSIRNAMFGSLLKQHEFDIPIVVVGNIAVGGTGKTPHTEYLVNLLSQDYRVGVLSRGYKRKTRGFVPATQESTPEDIGDEPYQIFRKYGKKAMVAVCENRVRGIQRMREIDPELNLIVLDDAFQHRYVKPTVSVVLTEESRLPYKDHMMPLGRLREPMSSLQRADVVVVTKCPDDITPIQIRTIKMHLNLQPWQHLIFSRYEYGRPKPVFADNNQPAPVLSDLTEEDWLLMVSGIANPVPFIRYLRLFPAKVKLKRYQDHHIFTHSDMESIEHKFDAIKGGKKYIITTEKDAVRLASNPYFPFKLREHIYYIPIRVSCIGSRQEDDLGEVIRKKLHDKTISLGNLGH